jgi:hypothetical protein
VSLFTPILANYDGWVKVTMPGTNSGKYGRVGLSTPIKNHQTLYAILITASTTIVGRIDERQNHQIIEDTCLNPLAKSQLDRIRHSQSNALKTVWNECTSGGANPTNQRRHLERMHLHSCPPPWDRPYTPSIFNQRELKL